MLAGDIAVDLQGRRAARPPSPPPPSAPTALAAHIASQYAKVKNDRVDAQMLAKLLAARMLPGTWVCDEVQSYLREVDFLTGKLASVDRQIARYAQGSSKGIGC